MTVAKVASLMSLLPRRPTEFWDRVATVWDGRTERLRRPAPTLAPALWSEFVHQVAEVLGTDGRSTLAEGQLKEIEARVSQGIAVTLGRGPFRKQHNADFRLARICYLACRALQPETVVETGVAYGVTTAFVLAALAANQRGVLHSIDLPPLGKDGDRFVGCLVPPELRDRWVLHRGATRRLLPRVLVNLPAVDMFIHDSLHTYKNMRMEFGLVSGRLAPKAVVISDDIQGNAAFAEWAAAAKPAFWATCKEEAKESLFGVAVIHNASSPGA